MANNDYGGIPVKSNNELSVIAGFRTSVINKLDAAIAMLRGGGPENPLGRGEYYKGVADMFEAVKGPIEGLKNLALDKVTIDNINGGKRTYKNKKNRRTRRR
jgi:hypothetical protein